jgi:hypothetical protein
MSTRQKLQIEVHFDKLPTQDLEGLLRGALIELPM